MADDFDPEQGVGMVPAELRREPQKEPAAGSGGCGRVRSATAKVVRNGIKGLRRILGMDRPGVVALLAELLEETPAKIERWAATGRMEPMERTRWFEAVEELERGGWAQNARALIERYNGKLGKVMAERLAELMHAESMSRGDLAAHANVSSERINGWLKGETPGIRELTWLHSFFAIVPELDHSGT